MAVVHRDFLDLIRSEIGLYFVLKNCLPNTHIAKMILMRASDNLVGQNISSQ